MPYPRKPDWRDDVVPAIMVAFFASIMFGLFLVILFTQ